MDWLSRLHPQATRAASAAQAVLAPRFADLSSTGLMHIAPTAPDTDRGPPLAGDETPAGPRQPAPQTAGPRATLTATAAAPAPMQPPFLGPLAGAATLAPATHTAAAAHHDAALPPASRAPAAAERVWPPTSVTREADSSTAPDTARSAAPRVDLRRAAADPPHTSTLPQEAPGAAPIPRPSGAPRASLPLSQPTRLPGGDAAATPAPLVVQVSIDRIDVRVPTPPSRPAPPARTATAASQGVSLADYLRGQRSGSRS